MLFNGLMISMKHRNSFDLKVFKGGLIQVWMSWKIGGFNGVYREQNLL